MFSDLKFLFWKADSELCPLTGDCQTSIPAAVCIAFFPRYLWVLPISAGNTLQKAREMSLHVLWVTGKLACSCESPRKKILLLGCGCCNSWVKPPPCTEPCSLCDFHLCSPSVLAGADVCHLRAASLMLNSLIRCLWHLQKSMKAKTIGCLCVVHTSISPWCFCACTLKNSLLCAHTPDGCLQSQSLVEESYSNGLMDNKLYWLCFWCEWMFSSWRNKRSPGENCQRYVSL